MYFKPVDIKGLTFRRGLFGFRKSDVEDFTRHVLGDYEHFQEMEQQVATLQEDLHQKQLVITEQNDKIAQMTIRLGQLISENTTLKELEGEYQDLEKMQLMAQRTANAVQEEADKLLARAKQENERAIRQAESQKMNQLMNIQIEVDSLLEKQKRLTAQVSDKKGELLDLEIQCEEIAAQRKEIIDETQFLKEKLHALRGTSLSATVDKECPNTTDKESAEQVVGMSAQRIS